MPTTTWYCTANCMGVGCKDPKIGGWMAELPEMPMDAAIQYGAEHHRMTGHTVELKNLRVEVQHGG